MEKKPRRIARLEELAFDVGFKSIVADLSACPENCVPPQKKSESLNSHSVLLAALGLKSASYVREFVWHRLELARIGLDIRQKFVKTFDKSHFKDTKFTLRPSAFLDSILNDSFESFTVIAGNPGHVADADLIEVISSHCPRLSKLTLDFCACDVGFCSRDNFIVILHELRCLTNLSDLVLKRVPRKFDGDIVVFAHRWPKLTSLKLSPLSITNNLFLGIVTPEYERLNALEVRILHRLQMNSDFRNELYRTLKYLDFKKYDGQEYTISQSRMTSTVAFLLRHLPNLEILKLPGSVVTEAIQLLWENPEPEVSNVLPGLATEVSGKFSGKLNLTKISYVDVYSAKQLKAISELCPALQSIRFSNGARDEDLRESPGTPLSPEIESLLCKFTNIRSVSFSSVGSSAMTTVVDLWSSKLTRVNVNGPVELSHGLLALCSKLADFCVGNECVMPFERCFKL